MPDQPVLPQETEARINELGSVDLAVAITASERDDAAAALTAARSALTERFPGMSAVVLYAHPSGTTTALPEQHGTPAVLSLPWSSAGMDASPGLNSAAADLIFTVSRRLRVKASALVGAEVVRNTPEWIDRLLAPVMDMDQDLVAPYYLRHPYAGAVTTGILYPLVRALYGRRLRYPLGAEVGCSPRLMERMLHHDGRPGRQAVELRLLVDAIAGGMQISQAVLGPRRTPTETGGLSSVLASALSLVFGEMERSAALWQKVRGSQAVTLLEAAGHSSPEPVSVDAKRMLDAFRLGQQNLGEVWGAILPPSTLVELKKLARQPDPTIRLPDRLWSHIVYDFSIAFHTRVMTSDHLIGALTPLYLGWYGAWYSEMGEVEVARLEDRLEQLCLHFEAEKPYLISRWRWPDRFNP
ncbi:MAG TPA: hypothetical protein VLB12_09460 [Gemmatimonadales bacterium]|nr:hypothetical protein [Gemmatimonadales bacterium]